MSFVAEVRDLLIDIGHCEVYAQYAALRTIETVSGDRTTAHHIVFRDTVYQFGVSCYYVRNSCFFRIAYKINECFLKTYVSNLVAVVIESQYTVETDGLLAYEESAQRDIFLHTAAGTDTNDVEAAFVLFFGAGSEVDVSERVDLVHHDIAVVGTDTGGDTRDTFALELTGNRMELARLHVTLDRAFVKERSHHVYTVLITHEDDFIRQELRFKMQMECRTIGIDD